MSQAFTQGFIVKDGQRVIDSSVGALTVQGDIIIGANKLRTTNIYLAEVAVDYLEIRKSDGSVLKNLNVQNVLFNGDLQSNTSPQMIAAKDSDNSYLSLFSRNNGVASVEVARLQGDAAPAFCVGNSGATANDDFAAVADQVKLGNYDIAAGRRTLALATEEAVAVEAALASTHTLSVRINGATYRILLTNA
jgi:hypothetical protein